MSRYSSSLDGDETRDADRPVEAPSERQKEPQDRQQAKHIPAALEPGTAVAPAESGPTVQGEHAFAARLKYLFATTLRRDGSRWTLNAVARATGGRVSTQQVYALYNGQSANPTLETIRALADVFGVEPEFFVRADAFAQHQDQLAAAYAALEADPQIAFVSRHMGEMSDADKALITDFVRRLAKPPIAPDSAPLATPAPARSTQLPSATFDTGVGGRRKRRGRQRATAEGEERAHEH